MACWPKSYPHVFQFSNLKTPNIFSSGIVSKRNNPTGSSWFGHPGTFCPYLICIHSAGYYISFTAQCITGCTHLLWCRMFWTAWDSAGMRWGRGKGSTYPEEPLLQGCCCMLQEGVTPCQLTRCTEKHKMLTAMLTHSFFGIQSCL